MPNLHFFLPKNALSTNQVTRREMLDQYFPSGLIPFEQLKDNEWLIQAFVPKDEEFYVDPHLSQALHNWHTSVSIEKIGDYFSFYKNSMISFYDSWSVYYWSLILSFLDSQNLLPQHITLFHVDDHQDLSSPHLSLEEDGYECFFSHQKVNLLKPDSVKSAVLYKSIGIDAFITPLLRFIPKVDILHFRPAFTGSFQEKKLIIKQVQDSLLSIDKLRDSLSFSEEESPYSYFLSSDLSSLLEIVDPLSSLFLHLDCDAFNNRYNLDMNWNSQNSSIDLKLDSIKEKSSQLLKQIGQLSIPTYMNIALSPGFFPAEFWKETCNHLLKVGMEYGIVKDDAFSNCVIGKYPKEMDYAYDKD